MPSIFQAFIFCTFTLGVTLAQDNTTTSNDNGDKMIGWVSPAPRRTTWSIIWSCMSIFIICSWKCVHLNIPSHEEAKGEWHTLRMHYLPDIPVWPKAPLWRKWTRKVLWMCCIALAPEVGVSIALREYIEAHKDLKKANKRRPKELKQKYTMTHAFYAQMGGIVIYDIPQSSTAKRGQEMMNRIDALEVPQCKMVTSLKDLDDMEVNISEHEIRDLSKADIITKTFAIIQCTWLTVQCSARSAQGYAISQLELSTLGFIFCAFIMHMLWWSKPFDLESRRVIPRLPQCGTLSRLQLFLSMDDLTEQFPGLSRARIGQQQFRDSFTIIDLIGGGSLADRLSSTALYLKLIGFSVIHLLAWNWEFPTPLIQNLWRLFNLGTAVVSILPVSVYVVWRVSERFESMGISFVAIIIVYALLRLGVLGLTFYCLSSMPERAYTTVDWLAWIPHFS
ncbi:hypothetical protein KAF25_002091 [Fusarium avenaceum]|uniref:Uncharacterized protein n=1 Tax=Fusarium avenaceum TaxID=40199 RepID=A0A9P7H743_9HYPO|nr:hypothetical protein KAF25_002091 [Fusarium avenaceum]